MSSDHELETLRAEIASLQKTIATLTDRLAALESRPQLPAGVVWVRAVPKPGLGGLSGSLSANGESINLPVNVWHALGPEWRSCAKKLAEQATSGDIFYSQAVNWQVFPR